MAYRLLNALPLEHRFWSNVDVANGDHAACWEWIGYVSRSGYGVMGINRRPTPAHRVSYRIWFGDFDSTLFVCHHCDNPGCVNPYHLFLGTTADNTADKVKKGRQAKGMQRGRNVKLTDDDVRAIRVRLAKGESQSSVARSYPVTNTMIHYIARGKQWRHVK